MTQCNWWSWFELIAVWILLITWTKLILTDRLFFFLYQQDSRIHRHVVNLRSTAGSHLSGILHGQNSDIQNPAGVFWGLFMFREGPDCLILFVLEPLFSN